MKAILSLIISGALVVSGYAQTRNVLVGTNNTVVQPTNFWSADASNARTGLGLGTAATNDASAFQPSSATLSNLASSNAVNLTNLRATNLVGLIPTSNIPATTLTNIGGTLAITQGGTGATNIGNARTNLGATSIGDAVFTATNAAAARTAIGALATNGDATNLTNFPANLLRTNGNGSGLANLTAANITGTVALASNVTGTIAVSNGGTGATNAATARTNLGLGSTNDITNRTLVLPQADGLGASTAYGIQWRSIYPSSNGLIALSGTDDQGQTTFRISTGTMSGTTAEVALFNSSQITFYEPLSFNNTTNAATTRTNLGLGWAALTNTTASGFGAALYGSNTNPVLVNTNGEVVSPTNFWQVSPANTRVQLIQPVTNSTNTATNARTLYLFSLAISTVGVTNTVQLPTNGGTLLGDVATVIHEGPTSSITAVRQIGSGTNIITLSQFQEAVKFIYESGGWRLADNISQVEPIYFSGTNASANAAASRTNLGLGNISMGSNSIVVTTNFTATNGEAVFTNLRSDYLEFKTLFIGDSTNTNVIVWEIPTQRTNFLHNLGLGPTNSVAFADATIGNDTYINSAGIRWGGDDRIQLEERRLQGGSWEVDGGSFSVAGSFDIVGETNKAITRTNLGLGETNNVTFNDVTASGTLTATSTVTAKTNLVVEGFVDFTTNRTNSNPATNNQINDFIEIRIGTNQFWLPVYK